MGLWLIKYGTTEPEADGIVLMRETFFGGKGGGEDAEN